MRIARELATADSVRSLPRLRGRVGEGVSAHALSFCIPPPCPSPASGGRGRRSRSTAVCSVGKRCPGGNLIPLAAVVGDERVAAREREHDLAADAGGGLAA